MGVLNGFELRVTGYELQVMNYEGWLFFQVAGYRLNTYWE